MPGKIAEQCAADAGDDEIEAAHGRLPVIPLAGFRRTRLTISHHTHYICLTFYGASCRCNSWSYRYVVQQPIHCCRPCHERLGPFHGQGARLLGLVAESVHTNPVVIRRLMTELEKAGLVKSVAGRSAASNSTAIPPGSRWPMSISRLRTRTSSACTRSIRTRPARLQPSLGKVLSPPLRAAECALHTSLAKTSIRDVATSIV
jgi:hypothetical protein